MNKIIKTKNNFYVFDNDNLQLFLKHDDNFYQEDPKVLFQKKIDDSILYKLVFNVANTCNLNCKYCYASGGNYKRENTIMTFEQADNILKKIFSKYTEIKTIYFFGGEPLINFKLIKYIVKQLEEHYGYKLDFRIVTNGIFLSKQKVDFFNTHNFKLYVSLDGPKIFQDYLRGMGTYDIIMDNLNYLKSKDISAKTEILCTYTKYHQKNCSLRELNDFFDKLGFKYSITDVVTKDEKLKIDNKDSFISREKKYIDLSIERILSLSKNIGVSSFLTSVIDALVFHNKKQFFCKELDGKYSEVYDFNGDEYSCIRLLGTFKKNDTKIVEINAKAAQICKNCWCKNVCSLCVADILLGIKDYPFISGTCQFEILYEYSLTKIIQLVESDDNTLEKLLNNYYSNYTK